MIERPLATMAFRHGRLIRIRPWTGIRRRPFDGGAGVLEPFRRMGPISSGIGLHLESPHGEGGGMADGGAETRRTWGLRVQLAASLIILLCWNGLSSIDGSRQLEEIPASGLGFRSRTLPLAPGERETFARLDTVKRAYDVGGRRFVLLVVDGSRNRHGVHDPSYCVRGAGWTVETSTDVDAPKGRVKLCRLRRGDETAEILYWFGDGTRRHGSALRYWIDASLRRLTLGWSGREPLLVLLQPLGDGKVDWTWILENSRPLFAL